MRKAFISERLTLLLTAAAGLALLVFLYPDQHPDSVASYALGEDTAILRATTFMDEMGYTLDGLQPRARLRRHPDLLDSLQHDLTRPGAIHALKSGGIEQIPAYYWEVTWDEPAVAGSTPRERFVLSLNQQGHLWRFLNPTGILPRPLTPPLPDSLRHLSEGITLTDTLPEAPARTLALYYLSRTPMAEAHFQVDSVRHAAPTRLTVYAHGKQPLLAQHVFARMELLSTGQLYELDITFHRPATPRERPRAFSIALGDLISFLRLGLFAVLVVLAAFTFFYRLRARLIDFNIILRDSLSGALALALFILNVTVPPIMANAGDSVLLSFLAALIGAGFGGGGGLLLLLFVIGSTDSLLREQQPEKLETLNLIRRGYLFSRSVGCQILRGTATGLGLAGLFTLFLYLFPEAGIALESSAFVRDIALSPLALWLTLSLWYTLFVLSTVLFGATAAARRIRLPRSVVPILFVLLTAILRFLPDELFPASYLLLAGVLIGVILYTLYQRYDVLTLLISGFVFFFLLATDEGWLIADAPFRVDAFLSGTLVGFLALYGFVAYRWGKAELPPYVPEYIRELARQERLQRELEIARQVQQSFLPQRMPEISGLQLAARCIPAYEVGGDYYDFVQPSADRLLTAVGDVSGKGIEAAFYMTLVKGMLQALGTHLEEPYAVLTRLNRLFHLHHRPGTFISMLCAHLNLSTLRLTFARAGHMPLLLARATTGTVEVLAPPGAAIGLLEPGAFDETLRPLTLDLVPGDTLLFFTDGVTEARNASGELFGEERLMNLFARIWSRPADEILQRIVEEVSRFAQHGDPYDDLTLLILKPTP